MNQSATWQPVLSHNFEEEKNAIKAFSEKAATDVDLQYVDGSKSGGEFLADIFLGRGIGIDHKVTGEELNNLTSQIKSHLINFNNTQNELIGEFIHIYNALEALDKDYIQAILASIHTSEITSESIQTTQAQIGKIVQNQIKTLEELKKFKLKIDRYTHLEDIDKIWSDWQSWDKKINSLSQSINNALEPINAFNITIGQITHLNDVDNMWNDIANHSSKLSELENRAMELFNTIQKNKAEIDNNISDTSRSTNVALESLSKNIKFLFWIAGGAAGLAIIEFVLILMKVI